MARILAVDWDSQEIRFLLGNVNGDQIALLKAGALPLNASTPSELQSAAEDDSTADNDSDESGEDEADESESSSENGEKTPSAPSSHSEADADENEADNASAANSADETDDEDEAEDGDSEKPVKKEDPETRLGTLLRRLLRENRVGAASFILDLPRSRVEILNMEIPRVSDAEMPEIVKNQVLRDSTTYNEGHPLDFIPLGSDGTALKVFSASITRVTLRHLRSLTSAAKRKPSRMELALSALVEIPLADLIDASEPTLFVQETSDEINLLLFRQKEPIYLRTAQIQADLPEQERTHRLKTEIIRTLAVGLESEAVPNVVLWGADEDYASLLETLKSQEIRVQAVNPLNLAGIKNELADQPSKPGRFAPLLGSILGEKPKKRPVLDLLHPRQKPKPPNYTLYFVLFFLVLGAALFALWRWNVKDLAAKNAEIQALQRQLNAISGEYQSLLPQWTVLNDAMNWDNFGVVLLDELRDITERIPSPPELMISRLAYNGLDPQFGAPVFIINAKVSNPTIYQKFYQALTADQSHGVNSQGVRQMMTANLQKNPTGRNQEIDYQYTFTAVILCKRRTPAEYLKSLPADIQNVSQNQPENYPMPPQLPPSNAGNTPNNQPNPDGGNLPNNQSNPDGGNTPNNQSAPDGGNVPNNQPNPNGENAPNN